MLQQQWKTIDTAPKDKRILIAFNGLFFGTYTKEVGVAFFDSNKKDWFFSSVGNKIPESGGVTHWMPLPGTDEIEEE